MVNDRFLELATEAGLQPFEDCGPGYVYKMEKFAELIVRDVVATVKRTQITSPDFEWVILNNYDIGVEE